MISYRRTGQIQSHLITSASNMSKKVTILFRFPGAKEKQICKPDAGVDHGTLERNGEKLHYSVNLTWKRGISVVLAFPYKWEKNKFRVRVTAGGMGEASNTMVETNYLYISEHQLDCFFDKKPIPPPPEDTKEMQQWTIQVVNVTKMKD